MTPSEIQAACAAKCDEIAASHDDQAEGSSVSGTIRYGATVLRRAAAAIRALPLPASEEERLREDEAGALEVLSRIFAQEVYEYEGGLEARIVVPLDLVNEARSLLASRGKGE